MSKFWPVVLVVVLCLTAVLPAAAAPKAPSACDPLLGTWAAGPDFNTTMVRAWGQWFAPNGKFYAMGGRSSDAAGSDLVNPREYDPATATWTTKAAAFPDNQVNNMGGGMLNQGGTDYIFVVGGSAAGATVATNTVKRYDPATDTLTVISTDPWPGAASLDTLPGGAAVYNNKLYIFGGFTINIGMTTAIYEFDPNGADGARWTTKTATLPIAKGYIPTTTIGNFIYLAGGSAWDGTTLIDTVEVYRYDPVADSITTLASLPSATAETRAVTMLDGKMWVLGGGRVAPNPSNVPQVYDPATDSWTTGPAFVNARRNFATDIDPATGHIYITGGYATTAATASTEIYTLCTPTSVAVSNMTATSGGSPLFFVLAAAVFIAGAAIVIARRK